MKNKTRNIILLGNGFVSWGGGLDFLRFCANALNMVCDKKDTRITVLLPNPENVTFAAKLKSIVSPYKKMAKAMLTGRKAVSHQPFTKQQLTDSFRNIEGNIEIVFYPKKKELSSVLAAINADVIIPCMTSLGPSFPIPWVGYIYDFQHRYYPDYFSADEIRKRDVAFSKMLSDAQAVIVNADDVAKDISKFFPDTHCSVFALPFSATPIESWFAPPADDLAAKYALPDNYFIICNQFYIHKDHETAFRALATYIQRTNQQDVCILCTGNTYDSRHPDYFTHLSNKLAQLGLTQNIHFLGHIPKKDQIDIMKGSIAVLQPTLFEGGPGGGAVYDAVATGVPAIVSDIAVNKEIDGQEGVIFFKVSDSTDLAEKMIAVQNMTHEKRNTEKLLMVGRERTKKFGLRLLESIDFVTNNMAD